jgi:hypothetical protein
LSVLWFFRLGQLKLLFVRARFSNEHSSATDRCRLRHDRPSRFPVARIGPIARPGEKGHAIDGKAAVSPATGDDADRFSYFSESTTELKLNNRKIGYLRSLGYAIGAADHDKPGHPARIEQTDPNRDGICHPNSVRSLRSYPQGTNLQSMASVTFNLKL